VSCFSPAHVAQHHFCGEDQGTWVHFVLTSVLRCSTVGGFKHSNAVRQVSAWCNTNAADLRSQCVRNVVTVQVQSSNHIVLCRTQNDLLQHGVSNTVFNADVFASVRVLEGHPRTAI